MIHTKRSAPHVIFLVNVVEPDADAIQHLILNILLYFLDCVDKRTTWGYRFFSSAATSISTTNQPFRPISVDTLEKFKEELVAQEQPRDDSDSQVAPFDTVKRALIQTIAEFHWSDADLSSESPRRQQPRKPSAIDVKNFVYLVTPVPQTREHCNRFVQAKADQSIPHNLRFMHNELRRWLWEDYIENRISLSWIDTFDGVPDDIQESISICSGVNAVLRPFGGCCIRSSKLTADYTSYGMSFASMFHNWCARTIKVVSEDAALPRTDEELLSNQSPKACWTGRLIFTPQVPPVEVHMYSVNESNLPPNANEIDIISTVYRYQINIRSLDTQGSPQIYILVGKEDFYTFAQQLNKRDAVAIVRVGDCFGVMEPKAANSIMLRILASDFKLYDIQPEQENPPAASLTMGSNALEFLDMPATTTKKDRLACVLKAAPKSNLKLAPLSPQCQATLQAMKERRRQRKLKIVEGKEKKEPITPLPSQEVQEKPVYQLPSTAEALSRSIQEIYLGTLYTQKWMLANGMKLMYDCIDHFLSQSKADSAILDAIASAKSMTVISSAFDIKHRDLIPTLMDTSDVSKIPNEEEQLQFIKWKTNLTRLQGRQVHELELKARNALKTREGKLQMAMYLLLIWLERRAGQRSKGLGGFKGEDHMPVDLDNPDAENQLNIYYTRVTIWENVYDVPQFIHELDSLDIKTLKTDPADLSNAAFCACMNESLSRAAPDLTKRLLEQCTEGDLMYSTELSSSQTPSIPDSQNSQPSSQKKRDHAPDRIPNTRTKKTKSSNLKDLPFMRREVDLSVRKRPEKTKQAEEATMARIQRSAVNGVPTMKRVGSFIKSASSPRRPKPEKREEEEDRVLKVREPMSPTTPRTRFERDFGISLSGLGYTPHRHGGNTPHRSMEMDEEVNNTKAQQVIREDLYFCRCFNLATRMTALFSKIQGHHAV
ncbi:hypothetical protein BJV82DRAFT_290047 [Fennellomyces sp. T-0311]|nr:hypothetical protein BJV82DRAFT_290047 [Fennellomyces sp. T-0311]